MILKYSYQKNAHPIDKNLFIQDIQRIAESITKGRNNSLYILIARIPFPQGTIIYLNLKF